MNRAQKNKTRGKQRADPADVPQTGFPYILSQYNGRANYAAGQYSMRVVKPLQPDGVQVQWEGITPASK